MMLVSICGIIMCLVALGVVFYVAAAASPKVSFIESSHFGANSTCPVYSSAPNAASWSCMTCLKSANKQCAFSANKANKGYPGACVAAREDLKKACHSEKRVYFTEGCPSKVGFFAVVFLGLYIISYAPGLGTVPWIVNSEIYPLRYRGVGGGIAAVSNWTANLIMTQSFLSLTQALGSAGTFLLYAGISSICLIFIYLFVPETKGLPIEDVEKMLEKGFKPSLFGQNKNSEEKA